MSLENDIKETCRVMRDGGVIVYPTDTVWGIGCDARRSDAVRRVFEIKHRADAKAMITLVSDLNMLERHVKHVPDMAYELIDVAVRPLTIVYDRGIGLAPELLGADGSVGIRLTAEVFSRRLCQRFGGPVVSTSANISGRPTPASFSEIDPEVLKAADYVVNFRRNDRRPHSASSVIKLTDDNVIKIIRP